MDEPRAQRTLVKSPPELWAEVSDAGALTGHLGAFGEIRITRLEPESTVAWEGDRARGTVRLEPAGWGTKVTLTAQLDAARGAQVAAAAEPEPPTPAPEPEPAAAPDPPAAAAPAPRRGLLARLFGRRRARPPAPVRPPAPESSASAPEPAAPAPEAATPAPEPAETEPAPLDAGRAEAILTGVLDDLGAAHHRPFSRG
jgi:hypothetical protein